MTTSPAPSPRPLFRLDPGWPFVLAGLALLVAGILIPAQRELHDLRTELRKVESDELRMYSRLEAYDRFLGDLSAGEPHLIRRLAIAQLNLVPKGEESFLLTPGMNQTVAQWIDESVSPVNVAPDPYPDTLLGRLSMGPNRLWLLASAVFMLFVGLLFGPDNGRTNGKTLVLDGRPLDDTRADDQSAGDAVRASVTAAVVADSEPCPGPGPNSADSSDHIRALANGAAFLEHSDDDDEFRSAAQANVIATTRPVLVIDDGESDAVDTDVIDVELISVDPAVSSADAPTGAEPSEELERERLTDSFADRVIGSDTERIAPPTDGAD